MTFGKELLISVLEGMEDDNVSVTVTDHTLIFRNAGNENDPED
jgi:hypothetical protein